MSKLTLALKYRPKNFNDVVGQDNQIKILQYQVETDSTKNAYLFVGPAGTGKTTCARIFANELNKGKGNPIEVDAARNNGVDDVRNIIDNSSFRSIDSKYKVYIIDECHMFSIGAWNAMLKLLEESPELTVFILCTTDPRKIPATILSRVQRYDFRKILYETIVDRLKYIIINEDTDDKDNKIVVSEEVIEYIAKLAEGGMRDAISMLDKCLSLNNNLNMKKVIKALGISNYDNMFDLLYALNKKDKKSLIKLIEDLDNIGIDLKQFIKQFYIFLIDINKYYELKDFTYIKIPSTFKEDIEEFEANFCMKLMEEFMKFYNQIKWEDSVKQLLIGKGLLLCQ